MEHQYIFICHLLTPESGDVLYCQRGPSSLALSQNKNKNSFIELQCSLPTSLSKDRALDNRRNSKAMNLNKQHYFQERQNPRSDVK